MTSKAKKKADAQFRKMLAGPSETKKMRNALPRILRQQGIMANPASALSDDELYETDPDFGKADMKR